MKKHDVVAMLKVMQENDPNGDWIDAPLDYDTMTAMFYSLLIWSKEGNDQLHNLFEGYAEIMTDAWDEVYNKIYNENIITDFEWEIFKHQAGEYDLSMNDGKVWIVLDNQERRLIIAAAK